MSIWSTSLIMDSEDHDDELPSPIAYQGSGHLPSEDDPHRGCLDLANIPGFVGRPDRPALHDGWRDDPYWPWLRLAVRSQDITVTVVLNRTQVTALRDELTQWVQRTGAP